MAQHLERSWDSREAYPSTNSAEILRVGMQFDFPSVAGAVLYTPGMIKLLSPLMESNVVRKDTVWVVHIQFVVRLIAVCSPPRVTRIQIIKNGV